VLRSEQAAHMSIFVIRAFVRLREKIAANAAILKRLAETLLQHDAALVDLYRSYNLFLPRLPNRQSAESDFTASNAVIVS
jgi:hypothetical protein